MQNSHEEDSRASYDRPLQDLVLNVFFIFYPNALHWYLSAASELA